MGAGRLFKRLKIPRVVGYIVMGALLGGSLLNLIPLDRVAALSPLTDFALAFARAALEGHALSLQTGLVAPLAEIAGSLLLGALAGWALCYALRRMQERDDLLVLLIGTVLLVAGLAHWLELPLILAEMALGMSLTNLAPNSSRQAFDLLKGITPPIYILFFILVGARLQIALLPQMGLVGLLYVGGRTAGKMAGAWLGGAVVRASAVVRNYLGFALFSQAGVAVGLALAVAQEFSHAGPEAQAVGGLVVNVIAATTFLVQLVGPPFVKFAIARAGEIPSAQEAPDANP